MLLWNLAVFPPPNCVCLFKASQTTIHHTIRPKVPLFPLHWFPVPESCRSFCFALLLFLFYKNFWKVNIYQVVTMHKAFWLFLASLSLNPPGGIGGACPHFATGKIEAGRDQVCLSRKKTRWSAFRMQVSVIRIISSFIPSIRFEMTLGSGCVFFSLCNLPQSLPCVPSVIHT